MKVGDKFTKDGEVAVVIKIDIFRNMYCILFETQEKTLVTRHVLTDSDFLEQYKPYKPVYEYRFSWWHSKAEQITTTGSYFKDEKDFMNYFSGVQKEDIEFQRLDFTKRERKCIY